MAHINLPIDLLRTFVTVIEVGSYTYAATLLGRTQPAISLQIKRLEELVDQPLIVRKGRHVVLTERGELLIDQARQILRLNDIAVSQFDRYSEKSSLRIGLPVDYGVRTVSYTHPVRFVEQSDSGVARGRAGYCGGTLSWQ